MVKASDLISKFQYALDNHWGYIFGRSGQIWTYANQKAATRKQTVDYGSQWIGHNVADCSGLGHWAFKELGGYIYHGSDTIWNKYVCHKSDLKDGHRTDGSIILPGDPVFLKRIENGKLNRHHIGYYIGNNTVIEAKGTKYGVVTSSLSHWHETAHWYNVEYENGVIYMTKPVLRRGSGCGSDTEHQSDVKELQNLLKRNGYNLEVDGKFGAKTEEVVKDYQKNHGLVSDGIVGAATWDSLLPDPTPSEDNITVSRNSLAEQRRKLQEVTAWIDRQLEG